MDNEGAFFQCLGSQSKALCQIQINIRKWFSESLIWLKLLTNRIHFFSNKWFKIVLLGAYKIESLMLFFNLAFMLQQRKKRKILNFMLDPNLYLFPHDMIDIKLIWILNFFLLKWINCCLLNSANFILVLLQVLLFCNLLKHKIVLSTYNLNNVLFNSILIVF